MSVLIFANGIIEDVEWIRPFLKEATAVIAANGGSQHLYRLERHPDHLIGDLDSISLEIQTWLNNSNCQIQAYPAEKNETDLELALLFAAEHFDSPILLFGMLGGRLDQMLANILLLTHPKLKTKEIQLVTQQEKAWLIFEQSQIKGRVGEVISLIPLKGDVYVNTTSGFKYPLHQEVLAFGPARGISNVLTSSEATVQIQSGVLLCVHNTTHQ